MKILITLLIIGYCCVGSDAILLALKAKLLGYKVGKAAGIATGLKKGALIGGIAGYGLGKQSGGIGGGGGGKVIKYYTNPIYSYDPRPLPSYGGHGGYGGGYGGHVGGYGGHGSHGPIIKVLHKHVPQSVNVYHHSHQQYGYGGISGGSYDNGHHHDYHHDHHHDHHHPSEQVSIIKVVDEGNHNIGHSGHGWA